jgi:dTDP-4-dehydrorhamnose reductase
MKVLVLGAGGQVGRAVVAACTGPHELVTRTHAELDITSATAVEHCIASCAPEWVVNAAAYTAVDRAESEPERAHALNGTAVGSIARAAASVGARLVHLSTDFVFDGTSSRPYQPGDAPHPLSVYGASKRAGEERALECGARAIVLRTAWVYATVGQNFVHTMLRLMRERPHVRVVSDQVGTPTFAGGLGRVIADLIEADAPAGIWHWTDLGVASWYDFAVAIQEEALARGLLTRAVPVHPISTAEYPVAARRPAFSVLDTAATRARVGTQGVHWRNNLRIMLDELRAA